MPYLDKRSTYPAQSLFQRSNPNDGDLYGTHVANMKADLEAQWDDYYRTQQAGVNA